MSGSLNIREVRQLYQSRHQDDGPSFSSRKQNEFLSHAEPQAGAGSIQLHSQMVSFLLLLATAAKA
jgi:hypothetical protein